MNHGLSSAHSLWCGARRGGDCACGARRMDERAKWPTAVDATWIGGANVRDGRQLFENDEDRLVSDRRVVFTHRTVSRSEVLAVYPTMPSASRLVAEQQIHVVERETAAHYPDPNIEYVSATAFRSAFPIFSSKVPETSAELTLEAVYRMMEDVCISAPGIPYVTPVHVQLAPWLRHAGNCARIWAESCNCGLDTMLRKLRGDPASPPGAGRGTPR